MGFPIDHKWGTSQLGGAADAAAAKAQGNAVPPKMMTAVAQAARRAGAFAGCWQRSVKMPKVPPRSGEPILRADLTPTVRLNGRSVPAWHISPPRARQSPLMTGWRAKNPTSTASSEWAAGLGARPGGDHDILGDRAARPFLVDDAELMKRVRRRLAANPLGGLDRVVTGAPRLCRQKYFADGCSDIQRRRLEADGFVIDFETMPEPYACKRNNPGASDPDYTPWLYGMIEESLVLTILVELDHRPFVRLPINVVTKSGYDVTSAPW